MPERRQYSDEERATALSRYVQEGAAATSRALNIPTGTLCSWAFRAGVQSPIARENLERMRAAIETRQRAWEDRRAHLLDQWGGIAAVATESTLDLLEDGNVRSAKDAATVAAIATDKAQLLSGGATSRIEAVDANTAILADIERLLEERRSVATSPIQVASHSTS